MSSRYFAVAIPSSEAPVKNWLAFLCLAFLLISCSVDIPAEIVGYWKGVVVPQDSESSADGRVEIVDHKYSTYHGT